MTIAMQPQLSPAAKPNGFASQGREGQSATVARMVMAARDWLEQSGRAQRSASHAVTSLSAEEHRALKAQMLASVADEVALQPDLDRAIAYLQALGQLAAADEEQAAEAA